MIWLRLAPPSLIAASLSQPTLVQINRSRAVRGTQWNPEDIVKQRSRKERLLRNPLILTAVLLRLGWL